MHICQLLAEKVMGVFDEAGATETQRSAALAIAKTLNNVWPGSILNRCDEERQINREKAFRSNPDEADHDL